MNRVFSLLLLILVTLALPSGSARAQVTDTAKVYVWPPEIYPGANELTINSTNGLQEIESSNLQAENMTIEGDGKLSSCPTVQKILVFVHSASLADSLTVLITDCAGKRFFARFGIRTWRLDHIHFGRLEEGAIRCQEFHISLDAFGLGRGADVILDSITSPDPQVSFQFPTELPIRITGGTIYRYNACYTADDAGSFTFPVITWIRRTYPSAGMTSYAVADTGTVFVVEAPVTDPTTFRSVAVPNAVIPPKGRFIAGSYDLLGLLAGYSITDNVQILAGGALPLPDDWGGIHGEMFGAYSIGAKAGLAFAEGWNAAVGYQWARSIYDQEPTPLTESTITMSVPWGAISYGDDDSRISATFGYAFKHHNRPLATFDQEFDREAGIIAIGGDYRFAHKWKFAGEIVSMQTLGVIPIVATMRYFTNTYALDFGFAFVGIETESGAAPGIPLAPVVSAVMVF
jgi:hypothetical protein